MRIIDLFRRKVTKGDFIGTWLAFHKKISRSLFLQFKDVFSYKDELDMLLAFKEIEYLVFWLLRRHLNETILIDMYSRFLEGSKLSSEGFREQLEIRYKIYDDAFDEFTSKQHRDNFSKYGLSIGQIVIKSVGELDLLKSGCIKDGKSSDIKKVFMAFSIWFEGIKLVDDMVETAKRRFRIEAFLRDV
jgi:hypothetical protein